MQNTKNESRKNQVESTEAQKKSLLKKFGFLWVISGAFMVHALINKLELEERDRVGYILILWLAASAVVFNMILYHFSKPYKDGWDDFGKGESDIVGLGGKKTDKRIYIEKNGIFPMLWLRGFLAMFFDKRLLELYTA